LFAACALGWLAIPITGVTLLPGEIDFQEVSRKFRESPSMFSLTDFLARRPHSRHRNEIDDRMWEIAGRLKNPDDWRTYQRVLPHGRHAAELEIALAFWKEARLTALRLRPDMNVKTAADLLEWFPEAPESGEVRRLLLASLVASGKGGAQSPPTAILRDWLGDSRKVSYSIEGFGRPVCWDETAVKDSCAEAVSARIVEALRALGLEAREVNSGALLRVRGSAALSEWSGYMGSIAKTERIVAEFSLYRPGGSHPLWTGAVGAQTPNPVTYRTVLGIDLLTQYDVHRATMEKFKEALSPFFRYW
jgi:hypothetical protein